METSPEPQQRPPYFLAMIALGFFVVVLGGVFYCSHHVRAGLSEMNADPLRRNTLAAESFGGTLPANLNAALHSRLPAGIMTLSILSDTQNGENDSVRFEKEGAWLMFTGRSGAQGVRSFLEPKQLDTQNRSGVGFEFLDPQFGEQAKIEDAGVFEVAFLSGEMKLFDNQLGVNAAKFGKVCSDGQSVVLGLWFVSNETPFGTGELRERIKNLDGCPQKD